MEEIIKKKIEELEEFLGSRDCLYERRVHIKELEERLDRLRQLQKDLFEPVY